MVAHIPDPEAIVQKLLLLFDIIDFKRQDKFTLS
jgi:hypothetical protein